MKHLIIILIYFPFILLGQLMDYELQFNSASLDYVEMPNASLVIANKTSFSISGWVNPQSNTNHGGLMGFRNNVDADFYLLQLQNTNNIEARFRNSAGINYDVVATNILDFNQWQHLSFTYDGIYIRLYKNGVLIDSTAASGTITQTTESFRLGSLDWQGAGFHMLGKIDEVRLWDIAISQTEINSWMCLGIDGSHPNYNNLMGYWSLDEGVGMTTMDLSGNGNNGMLHGGAVWQIATNCTGVSQMIYGCMDSLACNFDSLANIDNGSCLYSPIIQINQIGNNLEATTIGGVSPYTYLWSTLENTSLITPLVNGSYWCIVADANDCLSDTSYFDVQNIPTSNNEIHVKKELNKVVDMLGREISPKPNRLLFYIYNDGTSEKQIVLE